MMDRWRMDGEVHPPSRWYSTLQQSIWEKYRPSALGSATAQTVTVLTGEVVRVDDRYVGRFIACSSPTSLTSVHGLPRTSRLKGFEKPWTWLVGDRKATKASRGWSRGAGLHASSHTYGCHTFTGHSHPHA